MAQSQLTLRLTVADEAALAALAGAAAAQWRAVCAAVPLSIGLRGELGSGKTAWVRALLRGLGYTGRVPSPTYTLTEIYEIDDISLIHIDLYRLADAAELEPLGLRDWLGRPGCWLFTEWPERAPAWLAACDAVVELAVLPGDVRALTVSATTEAGRRCLAGLRGAVTQAITQGFAIACD